MPAFFFCPSDRALLCRLCDFSIHTASHLAQKHDRFLMPGARVGLHPLSYPDEHASACASGSEMIEQQQQQQDTDARSPLSIVPDYLHNEASYDTDASGHAAQKESSKRKGKEEQRVSYDRSHERHSDLAQTRAHMESSLNTECPPNVNNDEHSSMNTDTRANAEIVTVSQDGPEKSACFGLDWRVDQLLNIPNLADGYTFADVVSSTE